MAKVTKIEEIRNKKTLEQIKKTCNSKLTDTVTGPMKMGTLDNELSKVIHHYSPEYVVILIEKRLDLKEKYNLKEDYHRAIYITKEDFKKYK